MRIAVRRFEDRDAAAIDRLNRRFEDADVWHRLFKEDLSANPDRDLDVQPINDALFVAVDGDEIRGGAWLREQYFWSDGATQRVGWMKYPVAESLIDREFSGVPASMVLQFLRIQPRLLALGMGGHDAPFARLLGGIGWKSSTLPLFFRICRPFRVLRGLQHVRKRRVMRLAMDFAAWSGAGWVAHRLVQATSYRVPRSSRVSATPEPSFSPWADETWRACRGAYPVLAVRDAKALDGLYPATFPALHRLRVARGGADIGWACVQVLPSNEDNARYFGHLKVGLVTDVLALPSDALSVLAMGVRHLEELGVDLIVLYVSNQVWIEAARRLRFLPGPSNFAFYRSPDAEKLLADGGDFSRRCHFMRHTFGEDALMAEVGT